MKRVHIGKTCLLERCTDHPTETTDVLVRVTQADGSTTVMYTSPGKAEYLTTRYSRHSLLARPNQQVVVERVST